MKRSSILLTLVLLLPVFYLSCVYNSEEDLYPEECNTVNVTFSGTIRPILANNCLTCHSNANAAGSANGIRLEDYVDVQARASLISAAINHTGTYPMPKNGAKLKPCLIDQFDTWLSEGALNN